MQKDREHDQYHSVTLSPNLTPRPSIDLAKYKLRKEFKNQPIRRFFRRVYYSLKRRLI
jgi:hypothetical protein